MHQIPTHTHLVRRCGIIIPVYNSSRHLGELLHGIAAVQTSLSGWELPVLIIDDGSNPPLPPQRYTGQQVTQQRHEQNRGKGAALKQGFAYFLQDPQVQAVLTLDGDMQHPPQFIPQFLEAYEAGRGEVIVGHRHRDYRVMPLHRILSNWLTSRIISRMTGQHIPDSQCGFRLISRAALAQVDVRENRFHLESEFLIRCGWKKIPVGFVAIPTIYNGAPSAIRHLPDTLNFVAVVFKLSLERIKGHV